MSRLLIQPLPGMPFKFDLNGAIAVEFPPDKIEDVEGLLLRAIDELRALPPTEVSNAALQPMAKVQPPPAMPGGGGIKPPPQPHGTHGAATGSRGAGGPPPPPVPGVKELPQPMVRPPPQPLFQGIPQPPPRSQHVEVQRPQASSATRIPHQTPTRPTSGRIRLGAGTPGEAAAAARAAAEAQAAAAAAAAAPPPAPPVVATVADIPMAVRGGGATPGENQAPDGRLINPETGQPYKPATRDEKGRPIVPLPQPQLLGPPPPPK